MDKLCILYTTWLLWYMKHSVWRGQQSCQGSKNHFEVGVCCYTLSDFTLSSGHNRVGSEMAIDIFMFFYTFSFYMLDKLWENCMQTEAYFKNTPWACWVKAHKYVLSEKGSRLCMNPDIPNWVWLKPDPHALLNSICIWSFYLLCKITVSFNSPLRMRKMHY